MNASELPQRNRVAASGQPGITLVTMAQVQLAPAEARWVTVAVRMPAEAALQLGPGAHTMQFEISLLGSDGARRDAAPLTLSEKSTFVVPR